MKKSSIIYTLACTALLCACEEEWSASGPNREFQTQFRQESTTGYSEGHNICAPENRNDIRLYWFPVDDVYGYEIRYGVGQNLNPEWVNDDYLKSIIIEGADIYTYLVEDLQYNTKYRFAIRCLSNKGLSANPTEDELRNNSHNSSWYGNGDGSHQSNNCLVTSNTRYYTPTVMKRENVTETTLDLVLDLRMKDTQKSSTNYSGTSTDEDAVEIFGEHAIKISDDLTIYKADYITFTPSGSNEVYKTIDISGNTDLLTTGETTISVDGLQRNTMYVVKAWNNDSDLREGDKPYNTVMVRMKGDAPDAIVIYKKGTNDSDYPGDTIYDDQTGTLLNARRIDNILQEFMDDNELAEGTEFQLENGGVYYCANTVTMSKGFTLSCPTGRATVYMGMGTSYNAANGTYSPRSCNWSFGRNPNEGEDGAIQIEALKFENIDFVCEKAVSYEQLNAYDDNGWAVSTTGTGNYFINQYSEAMEFTLEGFEVNNCSFKNFIRGWIRVQGANYKIIKRFHVTGCEFSHSGMFKEGGQGYAFISCNESKCAPETNLFVDFEFSNNVVIDWPAALIATQKYTEFEGYWNINIYNNTFINHGAYRGDAMLDIRNSTPTDGMLLTMRNNLFVATRNGDSDSERPIQSSGLDIRKFSGVTFDIRDNYSTAMFGVEDPLADNSFWTKAANALSSTSRGAGSAEAALASDMSSANDAIVKVLTKQDGSAMYADDLFVAPRPLGNYTTETTSDNMMHTFKDGGFVFQQTADVLNSAVYTVGVGASSCRP